MNGPLRLRGRELARMTLRTPLLQAAWNYERMQGVGWATCLEPALERLCPDARARAARLAEHAGYFNTQPVVASLALGVVAALEERRAAEGGAVLDGEIARVKTVLGSALAGLGDALFWSTLRPLAALLGVLAALDARAWGAVVLLVIYNAVTVTLRARGVWTGYRLGPALLAGGVRRRLESLVEWGSVLALAACGLLFAALLVPGASLPSIGYQAALVAGLVAGLFTALHPRPSPTQWSLVAGVLCIALSWR